MRYAADVTGEDVWAALKADKYAILIDVRTDAEWAFVGLPDLSALGKAPVLISWQIFPHMDINPDFIQNFESAVDTQDSDRETSLYFLCRSGGRSASAAALMYAQGYKNSFNIIGGFEGELDGAGHRGTCGGWKAAGLPWRQN